MSLGKIFWVVKHASIPDRWLKRIELDESKNTCYTWTPVEADAMAFEFKHNAEQVAEECRGTVHRKKA